MPLSIVLMRVWQWHETQSCLLTMNARLFICATLALTVASMNINAQTNAQTNAQAKAAVSVDLSAEKGAPRRIATGFLHGISEDCLKPGPDYFDALKPANFRGANLGGFWIDGGMDKNLRMLKTYHDYLSPLGVTIDYILLDSWGFWYGHFFLNMPIRFPGDNGEWEDYEAFCETLATFVRDNKMDRFQYNLWNEPNLVKWNESQFWPRPRAQFCEMWRRGFQKITSVHPGAVISGPDFATYSRERDWKEDLGEFLDFCKEHNVVPHVLTLHALPGDPVEYKALADALLSDRGLAGVTIYINEYATGDEQHPAAAAWYIARLERAGVRGGRAIWQRPNTLESAPIWNVSGELNGLMYLDEHGLLSPTGAWWAYKRYADITGTLVSTESGANGAVDAVAGVDRETRAARILLGASPTFPSGVVTLKIKGFNAAPFLVKDGKVRAIIEKIPYHGGTLVAAPESTENEQPLSTDGEIVLEIKWERDCAYAVTLQ
jgi:hypothetical protein